jgi:hypothetical protein
MLLSDVTPGTIVAEFAEATLCTLVSPIKGALPSLVAFKLTVP